MSLQPGLYVTATPIGNLKDITFRAVDVLRQADVILCEDKRVTAKLCQAYEIKTPLSAYHDHNGEIVRPKILDRLRNDQAIAIVSDAGTPLISDPGYKLVKEARDQGFAIFTVPGPCAAIAGLSIAGAPTDQFMFAGFLPPKAHARRKTLMELSSVGGTLIFYETGPRLTEALADVEDALGNRKVAIARELTKLHEELRNGTARELCTHYKEFGPPRGEIVLIVYPPEEESWSDEQISQLLTGLLADHSVKDAASMAAEETGMARKTLYKLALDLKKHGEKTSG
ncbi:MAG: 16S rRNA (cytidine(1402)-2'-O)-methyltransferase [Aquisalinus sp.]|nr:16S rRNA (cytidine(1402)-2'-O)-methyltransferase [Aquisalinus sp.]